MKLRLHTGQNGTALICGCGKDYLFDHSPEDIGFQMEIVSAANGLDRGHSGKIAGIHPFDVGFVASAFQVERLTPFRELHVNLAGGQGIDKLSQQACGNGDAAFFLNPGADPAVDADFQVGGGKLQTSVVAFQQDVRQDGQGRPAGHRPANRRKPLRQILLQATDLHGNLLHAR